MRLSGHLFYRATYVNLMGVNVGTHLCIRRPGQEIEYLCSGPWIPRNYGLYGLMAGVGSDIVLFEPRGIPEDASRRLRWELKDSKLAADEYAHSWLTTEELREVARAYEAEPSFLAEPDLDIPLPPGQEPSPTQTAKLGPHFSATIGAMEGIDRWCEENGGGQAILAFSFS